MQNTTSSALALSQESRRPGQRRMLVKRVGVAVVAAAFAGSLVVPAGLQVAAAEPQQLDPSIALLLEQQRQTVVVEQSELVSVIAQQGLSATTPEQLAEAQEAAAAAEQARQAEEDEAAAAAEAEEPAAEATTVAQDAPASAAAGGIVGIAQSQLGVPYVWGGASPATGFDCSGFTQWVYGQVGISLPHSDRGQYGMGTPVSPSQAQPGDLIVWNGHTAIYVGNDTIIHAPTAGSTVKYTSYSAMIGAMGTPYVGRF